MNVTEYHRRGLCCIPIRPRTKIPTTSWERFQARRPCDTELSQFFGSDGASLNVGIGIVCGAVSAGGLVVRDFDDRDSFNRWRSRSDADQFPTVETARGGHVYGLADPEGFLRLTGGRSIVHLADGELRGGGYVLAPPSVHPTGHAYRWSIPLGQRLPSVDPVAIGWLPDDFADNDQSRNDLRRNLPTDENKSGTYSNCLALAGFEGSTFSEFRDGFSLSKQHWQAIHETLPTGPGERNRAILSLVRRLRGLRELVNGGPANAEPILIAWFGLALPIIRTKDYAETRREFFAAWDRVRFPKGDGFLPFALWKADQRGEHPTAKFYGKPRQEPLRRLVGWCSELNRIVGGSFWLATRDAGELLGIGKSTAARMLRQLRTDGVLTIVKPATRTTAPHYRFHG